MIKPQKEEGAERRFFFLTVKTNMTLIRSHIFDLLKESKIFTVVVGEPADDTWLVASSTSGGICVEFGLNSASITGVILAKQAELVTMYAYGQIAERCRLLGCAVGQLQPGVDRSVKITISKEVPLKYLLSTTAEMETELGAIDRAIDSVAAYLQKVASDCELSSVDISMFADVDVGSFELGEIVQRRYVEFISWESLIESVTSNSDNEDFRNQMVLQIRSCEAFEKANPHLALPEIANHLIVLVSDTYPEKSTPAFEIN